MDWCRLSTSYYLDGALLRAGEAAEVLFLRCLAYSGAQESRGLVPKHVLPMLTPTRTAARAKALVAERLLLDEGDHLRIRQWSFWQEALDTEAERRRKDRERKRAEREAKKSEDASVDLSADSPRTVQPESARKEVEVEVEVEEERDRTPSVSRPRKTRGTPAPDLFPITPELMAWGRENAPLVANPKLETARFLDYWRANGKLHVNWTAAWRNWMLKANEIIATDQRPASVSPGNPHTAWAREQG